MSVISKETMKACFDKIDQLKDITEINKFGEQLTDSYIMELFWNLRVTALFGLTELERRKALIKCRYICLKYSGSVPLTTMINRFTAPHGLRGIVVSQYAKIGEGCTIFQNVTIGSNTLIGSKGSGFPEIGDNVYIGAGAAIIGDVKIGNNVRIGANCIVTDSIPNNCSVIMDKPRIIKREGTNINNKFISAPQFKTEYMK